MLDLLPDVEDEMFGVRILPLFTVDEAADAKRMRIAQLVRRHDPRAHWGVGIEALAERPLRRGMLGEALGHIVADAIAKDRTRRVGCGNVFAALADHRDHFGLVIIGEGTARDQDRIVGAVDRGLGLGEPDLLLRRFHFGFGDVIGVIEADRKDLAGALNRRLKLDRGSGTPPLAAALASSCGLRVSQSRIRSIIVPGTPVSITVSSTTIPVRVWPWAV